MYTLLLDLAETEEDNENGAVINCIIQVSSDLIRNIKPAKIHWTPKPKQALQSKCNVQLNIDPPILHPVFNLIST